MHSEFPVRRLRYLKSASSIALSAFLIAMACSTSAAAENEKKETGAPDDIIASLSPSPSVKTRDGAYQLRLAGFLQIDHVENSSRNSSVQDETTVRRARIGVRGVLASDWRYNFMVETGRGGAEIFDADITYTGLKGVTARVGQFKEPLGLEWAAGCPWWTFMDRALVASLTPNRSIGVAAATGGKVWRVHAGYFPSNASLKKAREEDGVATGRFYFSPVHEKTRALHIGVSGSVRNPDAVTRSVRFKGKHETAAPGKPAVDTGKIENVDKTMIFGAEALGVLGPVSLQAEYINNYVKRDFAPTLHFTSLYAEASWFITGESRAYKFKRGGVVRVRPNKKNDIGAVQLAARYDKLDLNDKDVAGGSIDRYTLGLNWYPTTNIRAAVNYVVSDVDENAVSPSDRRRTIGVRAQLAF